MQETQTDQGVPIGIGLIPTWPHLENIVRSFSSTRIFAEWKEDLGLDARIPHLSLLHANVLDYEKIISCVQDLYQNREHRKTINGQIIGVDYVERGWYFINFEKTPEIINLHRELFFASREFLRPGIIRNWLSFDLYRPSEQENFLNYGYRYILNDFRPHITLGRTPSEARSMNHNQIVEETIRGLHSPILFDEIAAFELGADGTLIRKIRVWPLEF